MAELTGFSWLLSLFNWLYLGLAIAALAFALRYSQAGKRRALAVLLVIAVFGYVPATTFWNGKQRRDAYQAAKTQFEMRCKHAGEKIFKTVDDVEGIVLLKVRPEPYNHLADQMWPGAAFASEFWTKGYIESFLLNASGRSVVTNPSDRPGYQYVEVVDEDGTWYRYRLKIRTENIRNSDHPIYHKELVREKIDRPTSHYGVTFEDEVNAEDRKHWVAGSTVKVLDLLTNEVLAEYTRYAVEYGQGNTNVGRRPWLRSDYCGSINLGTTTSTRFFVEKVLKPIQGK